MPTSIQEEAPGAGEVLAVGPGRRDVENGERLPVWATVGKKVMYSRFDPHEVTFGEEDYALLRDSDVLLSYDGDAPTIESIRMPYGKVLVRLLDDDSEASGGIVLPKGAAQPETSIGTVVAVSDGALGTDGQLIPLDVEVGDVVRFSYGSKVALELGKADYRAISAEACLAKWKA